MAGSRFGSTANLPAHSRTPSDKSNNGRPPPEQVKVKSRGSVEHYFHGPRDTTRHSRLPLFFRLHGSVLPHLIVPIFLVSAWVTFLCFRFLDFRPSKKDPSQLKIKHTWDSTMLTVLGFLVGIGLSLRNTTAYERFSEGRRYWANMRLHTTNIARMIWVNVKERDGDQGKEDLLGKITAINLLVAFTRATMHRLRFEPYIDYDDLRGYVDYLQTYARDASVDLNGSRPKPGKFHKLKRLGQILGLSFTIDNPRSQMKKAHKPLGNLPLELLIYLQAYFDSIFENKTLTVAVYQQQSIIGIQSLNDILTGVDRIVNTPLPIAYSITIAQISWVYIIVLPFMIMNKLQWITIPATILAAYIILGLGAIGAELENPFGEGVNDLPLENFCDQIQLDCDVIMSRAAPKASDFIRQIDNMPLYPLYMNGYADWSGRSKEDITEALRAKVDARGDGQGLVVDQGVKA